MRNRLIVVGLAVTVGVPALGYAQAADAPPQQNPAAGTSSRHGADAVVAGHQP